MTSDNARQLLDKFYNGTSTPSDIEQLKSFFATATDIPDDMMADAILFSGAENPEAAPVPDITDILGEDLLSEIDSAVAEEQLAAISAPRRLRPRYVWFSAAAAACMLLVLTFGFLMPDNNLSRQSASSDSGSSVTAKSESTIPDTVSVETLKPAPTFKEENMAKAPSPVRTHKPKIKKNVSWSSNPNNGYNEINDPEVARETLEDTYNILRESFARVNKNMPDISAVVERNNTIVSNSLRTLQRL